MMGSGVHMLIRNKLDQLLHIQPYIHIHTHIHPKNSPEGLMLKLKPQYLGHLMLRANSLEMTLMLGKTEGRRRKGQQRMRWLDGITDSMDRSLSIPILGKFSTIISSSIFSWPFFLSSSSGTPMIQILVCLTLSQKSLRFS